MAVMKPDPKDYEGCERCGAYLLKALVHFHQCRGSDWTKRPANVPLAKWVGHVGPIQPLVDTIRAAPRTTAFEESLGKMQRDAEKRFRLSEEQNKRFAIVIVLLAVLVALVSVIK